MVPATGHAKQVPTPANHAGANMPNTVWQNAHNLRTQVEKER